MTHKRVFDIVVSFIALQALFPLFVVIAIFIKLSSRGPVLFKQRRMGFRGKGFVIYKFRTMHDGTGKPNVDLTSPDDPRITWIGHFLRRSRLDELPQFWNVLRGEMSIVGPRPYEITSAHRLNMQAPRSVLRYTVKSGITGLAQINGRQGKKLTDMENDINYDLDYVNRQSLQLDVVICLKTVPVLLRGKGI